MRFSSMTRLYTSSRYTTLSGGRVMPIFTCLPCTLRTVMRISSPTYRLDVYKRQEEGIGFVKGDAADLAVLESAGIRSAPSVIITTHDDDTNIYLTIYCRRLRPDMQIISRATLGRNVGILHSAGADLVLSLVSMMSDAIINLLSPGRVFMLSEGLNLFRVGVGRKLLGRSRCV